MKATFTIVAFCIATASSLGQAATKDTLETFFRENANPVKFGLSQEKNGVKTTLSLLSCNQITLADDGNTYGVCTFQVEGYMTRGVYSAIVNPSGYGFSEAVEVGNFID